MDISSIQSIEVLENIVQMLAINIDSTWLKYSKDVNITKYFKAWWNKDCRKDINKYQQSQSLEDWKKFKKTVKKIKYVFFDNKIDEITNKKYGLWKLMNWVKKCKLLAIKSILFNCRPCIKLDNLWDTLHNSFNSAQA